MLFAINALTVGGLYDPNASLPDHPNFRNDRIEALKQILTQLSVNLFSFLLIDIREELAR